MIEMHEHDKQLQLNLLKEELVAFKDVWSQKIVLQDAAYIVAKNYNEEIQRYAVLIANKEQQIQNLEKEIKENGK